MNVLLVEDNAETREVLKSALCSAMPDVTVTEAADAASGRELFAARDYDLTILDLEIPSTPGSIAGDIANGEALLGEFRRECAGGVICVLSAHSTAEGASKAFTDIAPFDVYGDGVIPSLSYVPKDKMRDAVTLATKINSSIATLDEAIFARIEPSDAVNDCERRLLLRIAVGLSARRLVAKRFGSGLSSSKVFAVKLFDSRGSPRGFLAVKLDVTIRIVDEFARYQKLVVPLLESGDLAPVILGPLHLGRRSALAYRLASSRELSLFQLISQADEKGAKAIRRLSEIEHNWVQNVYPKEVSVANVRRMLVEDARTTPAQQKLIDAHSALEAKMVWLREGTQHGDMHGENVLCTSEGDLTIIDYADVGRILPPADSVMLELSLIFHPAAKTMRGTWPTAEQCANWSSLDLFLEGCPFPETIRACREWSKKTTEAVSDHGVFAIAYAYAVWQSGFDPANVELAVAVAENAARNLR